MRNYNNKFVKTLRKAFLAFLLIMPFSAMAIEEQQEQTLKGSAIVANATVTAADPVFVFGPWSGQTAAGVQNIVQFEIDFDNTANKYFHNLTFTATCKVDIACYGNPASPGTVTQTYTDILLTINYNPATGATFKGIANYKFNGAYKVVVTVKQDISVTGLSSAAAYPIFKLTNKLIVDRQYNFNDNTTDILTYKTDGYKLDVNWIPTNYPGAESFDLEWTYIDAMSAEGTVISTSGTSGPSTAVLDGYFKNNNSRVNVTGNKYQFNLNYNQGYILFRIRGVQFRNSDGIRMEGNWNYNATALAGSIYNYYTKGIVQVDWHEQNLNWQYNAVYAEDGKKKEVISYFDGSLRSRQTVTINNEDNISVVAEPVYDAMGRASMSILPAPVNNNRLTYYRSFNLSTRTGNPPVSYKDIPSASCGIIANTLSATSGVEQYYSANNPFMADATRPWMKAIPKSEGFPFSVTQFTPDNTGRIRAQGGVGKDFQLGTGHETKYYYGKPSQYELDRLFGAEAGEHTHYLKNMVQDANGQVSVSYQNSEGKTIATALAGLPPANTEALATSNPPLTTVKDVLLTPSSFQINNAKSSLEATSTFLVASSGHYKFTYKFTPEQYNETFSGGTLCYTCSYDLLITFKDECGNELKREEVKKITPFNTNCVAPTEQSNVLEFDINKIGEYTVYFELAVNKETLDQYTEHYLTNNTDIKKLNYFLLQQLIEENLAECYNDCDACSALPATEAEFVDKIKAYYIKENLPFGAAETSYAQQLYTAIKENCTSISGTCTVSPCAEVLDVLKADVTPGGQYAEIDNDYQLIDPEINVLTHYSQETYYDENGQPAMVEDDNGNMVPPSSLSLKEFVEKFEDSWANSLAKYHPEYCYYIWCTMNEESQLFNQRLEDLNDPIKAQEDHLFDRNNPLALLQADPFFNSGNGSPFYGDMQNDLNAYSNNVLNITTQSSKDILKTIDYVLYCGTATPPVNWDDCNKSPDDPCRSAYKEWLLYKQWYLERKLKYYTMAMKKALPECSNCFIPSSGGADPAEWVGCIAPAINNFTVEVVQGSTADGLKRIIIKYKGGNEITQWPLDVQLSMTSTVNGTNVVQPVIFAPGFGTQEITVQEDFDVFTITGVSCATIVDGKNTGKQKRFANPLLSKQRTIAAAGKILKPIYARPIEPPVDWDCPEIEDFNLTTISPNGVIRVCYTGPAVPLYHSATAFVEITLQCGHDITNRVVPVDFCNGDPICKDYPFDSNNCVVIGAKVIRAGCDIAPCVVGWECPKDSKNFTITVTSPGPAKTEIKVCYTGPSIPPGKKVRVLVSYSLTGNCSGTESFYAEFCSNSSCFSKIFTARDCGVAEVRITEINCEEGTCEGTWQCPEKNEFTTEMVYHPGQGTFLEACYTGTTIPAGKKIIVTVLINSVKCGPIRVTLSFCAGNPFCQSEYVFPDRSECAITDFIGVESIKCVDEECEWQCPVDTKYYTVTATPISNSPFTEIKVCYTGPAIPTGKSVIVHLGIRTECGEEYDRSVTFCSGTGSCTSFLVSNGDCKVKSANIIKVECKDEPCGWECPKDPDNYSLQFQQLSNGNWQVQTCYTGPAIPPGKKVKVEVFVDTKCGGTSYTVTFCSENPLCDTHQFTNSEVCERIERAYISKVECTDEPCGWECPTDVHNYTINQVYNPVKGGQEITICYTGPAIPFNKTVIVPVSITSQCLEQPINYEIKFCQGVNCNTYFIPLQGRCESLFYVSIKEIKCEDAPCSQSCPEANKFTASANGQGFCQSIPGYQSTNITVSHTAGPLSLTLPIQRVKVKVEIKTYHPATNKTYTDYKYVWFMAGMSSRDFCFIYPGGRNIISVTVVETECKGACPGGDCCDDPRYSLYEGKVRRFQDYVEPPDLNTVMASYQNGSLNFTAYPMMTCKNECEAMADGWIQDLKNCTTDPVRLERVRRKLIEVCKQSCVLQQGNSTIHPYSDNNTLPSFESVIIDEFGSLTPDCAYDLISDPYPWGKSPILEKTFATETNTKICDRLQQLRNESLSHGYGDDVTGTHKYLKDFYKPYYDLEEEELQDLFTGCLECNGIMPLPVELPPFMDGDAKPCLSCDEYEQLVNAFNAKYPGITPAHDKYEVLFRNFANHQTGFSHAFANYYDFAQKCTQNQNDFRTYGHICETPLSMEVDVNLITQCMDEKFYNALSSATVIYNAYIDSVKRAFRNNYTSKCLSAKIKLESEAKLYEYHYTLYYYDQSGDMVKSIPPKGVAYLTDMQIATLQNDRSQFIVPSHTLASVYQYNSRNQVILQFNPDGGVSQFWYDKLGRLVASQNEEQKAPVNGGASNRYSYTKYEPLLGRVVEVGEKAGAGDITTIDTRNEAQLQSWLASGTDTQITETIYDKADNTRVTNTSITSEQQNYTSRKRVVSTIFKKVRYGTVSQYDAATHYSYDVNGNAKIVWQENSRLKEADAPTQGLKRLDYNFDLVSGNINKVYYQKGKGDQFIYLYQYDAKNRIIKALSSRDGLMWQTNADYKYYLHGPLARLELGNLKVQGMDYAYTLQGWMKYINGPVINEQGDIGRDGDKSLANNVFGNVARDAIGYSISYFDGEYKSIQPNSPLAFSESVPGIMGTGKDLFNGNIRATTLQIAQLGTPKTYSYSYDQLNRLVKMRKHESTYSLGSTGAALSIANPTSEYQEDVTYDPNGNIITYLRNGKASQLDMDNLTYNYVTGKNQLDYVQDGVLATNYAEDIDGQSTGNYTYDKIGNLIKDNGEKIGNIEWTMYGKIRKITKTDANSTIIEYEYDPGGNRIYKKVTTAGSTGSVKTTYYVRDASNNSIAVYTKTDAAAVQWAEQHLYGSNRVGMLNPNIPVPTNPLVPTAGNTLADGFDYGKINYEMSNHLSNVLATVSDKKIGVEFGTTGTVDYFNPEVITASDYYPFGMLMPQRSFAVNGTYRFGFNKQEKSTEIEGNGNSYTAEFWQYDGRLGRRWNVDPIKKDYESPYVCLGNNPMISIDPTGADSIKINGMWTGKWRLEEGDTYESLSKRFGTSIETLKRLNKNENGYKVGDAYTVQGETTIYGASDGALAVQQKGALEVTPLLNYKMNFVYRQLEQGGHINFFMESLGVSVNVVITNNSISAINVGILNNSTSKDVAFENVNTLLAAFGVKMDFTLGVFSNANVIKDAQWEFNLAKSIIDDNYKKGYGWFGQIKPKVTSELKKASAGTSTQVQTYMNIMIESIKSMFAKGNMHDWTGDDPDQVTLKGDRFFSPGTNIYHKYLGITIDLE